MVKNKAGGNKSKKSARKFTNPAVTNRKLRLAEEDETYAVVLRLIRRTKLSSGNKRWSYETLCNPKQIQRKRQTGQ